LGFLIPAPWAEKPIRAVAAWQFSPSALRTAQALWQGAFRDAALFAGASGVAVLVSFLVLVAASAMFGRWYCAFLCPLGFLQDLVAWGGKKNRRFRKSNVPLRAAAFAAFIVLGIAGAVGIASWIEPWSLMGRFFAYDAQPLVRVFLRVDAPEIPGFFMVAAGAAFTLVLGSAAFWGRWFCNSVCPVGSALGMLNRLAPFRLRLDTEVCSACGRCSSVCLADCMDGKNKHLDSSRCVYCLECVSACPSGAIRYGGPIYEKEKGQDNRIPRIDRKEKGQDSMILRIDRTVTRSDFLGLMGKGLRVGGGAVVGAALGAGAATLARKAMNTSGFGVATLARKAMNTSGFGAAEAVNPVSYSPVSPPGSLSIRRFTETCTACGLCVARCPSKILRPSTGQFGLAGLFAPRLDYDVSYCQFSCTTCLDLCPSGALVKMRPEEKQRTKIGDAALVRDLCIVIKNGTKCGACAEHCPTGAVRMVVGSSGLPEPVFSSSICIGCGACHHACPVKPQKAITVSGLAVHEVAQKPSDSLFGIPSPPAAIDGSGLFPF
jgi:polyferredoxin